MATKKEGESKEVVIKILPFTLDTLPVRLVGTHPLLTNRISERAIAALRPKNKLEPKSKVNKPPQPTAEEQFEESLYRRPRRDANGEILRREDGEVEHDGKYYFPSRGILRAMVDTGSTFLKIPKTQLRGVISIQQGLLEIKGAPPQIAEDTGKNNNAKGQPLIVIYRPEFHPWYIDVDLLYDRALISAEDVFNLLKRAGILMGIGPWRPQKGGHHGTWDVEIRAI